jgi:PAS domain S-box-containing protein
MEAHPSARATAARPVNIAIIGGGRRCETFLHTAERLWGLRANVLGVADPDPEAVGISYARSKGIFTCPDMEALYNLPGLDAIIELTGSGEVRDAILKSKPRDLPLVDHDCARLFTHVMNAELAVREELQADKGFFETVINGIRDEIVVLGSDLCIVDVNEAVVRRLGWPKEELLGRNCHGHGFEESCQSMDDPCPVCKTLGTGRSFQRVRQGPHEDGGHSYYRVVTFPVLGRGGEVSQIIRISRDITERRRAEEALEESERRYRALVDSSMVGVFRSNVDGKIIYANEALALLLGFERPEDVIGLDAHQFYADQTIRRELVELLKAAGSISSFQFDIRTVQGEVRTILASASLRGDTIEGMLMDITDRKEAQEALRESGERYRTLVETTETGYVLIDLQGRVQDANAQYVRLTGHRSLDEIVGRCVTEWTAPHDLERNAKEVAKCGERGFVRNLEVDYIGREGRITPVEINATAVETPQGPQILTLCQDITDRRQAQEALRASEERFRALVESTSDWVWEVDEDGVYTYVSPQVRRLLGWEPEEVLGKTPFDLMPVEEARRVRAVFESVTPARRAFAGLENTNLHKDGHPVVLETSGVPVFDAEDRFRGYRGIDRDITERRRAEEALRASEERFRTLAAVAPAGIVLTDPRGQVTYANEASCRIVGRSAEEMMGWGWSQALHPADRERIRTEWAEAATSGRPYETFKHRFLHPDGSVTWVHANAAPIRGEAGELLGHAVVMVDITDRKQAQEALENSLSLLRATLESTADGILVVDAEGQVVSYNQKFLRMWGMSEEDIASKDADLRFASVLDQLKDPESFQAKVGQIYAQPELEVSDRLEFKDGRVFERYSLPQRVGGACAGRVWSFCDITERKRAEERLAEETRLTEGIVDGCPVALFVIGRDHKLVFWNRACEELTGLSREEMLGTDRQWEPFYDHKRPVMADLLVDGELQRLGTLYQHMGLAPAPLVRDGYKGEGYFESLGSHLYFLAAPVYDENGHILGAIETLQDVSETKRLESRLHEYSRDLEKTVAELESKTRKLESQEASQRAYTELLSILNSIEINQILRRSLRRIVEQANCQLGLIYLREDASQELRLMASYSVDAAALDAPLVQPASGLPAKVVQEVRRVTIRDIPQDANLSFDLGFARATPRTVVGLPITFRERVLGALVVASIEDMSEATLAFLENCLRQVAVAINNALAFNQIERQSQELADINRELAEASRLKSEFVANMSHELRTPLNSILGFSEILLRNREANLTERQLGNIEKIRRNGAGLLTLINSILDLSKVEAGKMDVASEPTNVRQVVEECVEAVRPLADQAGLDLVLEPIGEVPIIRSDAGKIGQVLTNLLSNAIKFTEQGSVKVGVNKRRRREDPIEISVEDTGIGIAPQHLQEVFKEFRQLDGSANRRYEGTGLGLSISRRLAEILGGSISIDSEQGKGSRFTFVIPVVRREDAPHIEEPAPEAAAGVSGAEEARVSVAGTSGGASAPPMRVLVIGADADCIEMVEREAEAMGCEVAVCATGPEGVRLASESPPGAVVLDLSAPERTGWAVLTELRAQAATRELPVAVISAPGDRRRAYYLGATQFVARPAEAAQVRSALGKMLRPGRTRIIVVDDEPEYLEAIREWLGDAVGEVCPARNGLEALKQVEARRPDAIFLDLMMPHMDGREFLRRVRAVEGCGDLPVVIVTGKELGSEELAALQDGATSVIQKGFAAQIQVMQQLERILGQRLQAGGQGPRPDMAPATL